MTISSRIHHNFCVIVLVASVFFVVFPLQKAFANDQPQMCKADDGQTWYFSLGKVVFKLSASVLKEQAAEPISFFEISDLDPRKALVPPDPTAPKGCIKNPQQLGNIRISEWPEFGKYNYLERVFQGQMPHWPNYIQLSYDPISASDREKNGEHVLFPSNTSCGGLHFQRTFSNGTVYCTSRIEGLSNPDPWRAGWILLVPNQVYSLPLPWEALEVVDSIEGQSVTYWFSDFIYLQYHTFFQTLPMGTLAERSIDFDRAVQSSLTAAEIPRYPWPVQDAAGHNK